MRLFNIKSRLSCLLLIGMMCCTCFLSACKDENVIEIDGSSALPNTSIESINTNVKALRRLIEAKQLELDVKSYNPVNNGASYTVELSDGTKFQHVCSNRSIRWRRCRSVFSKDRCQNE